MRKEIRCPKCKKMQKVGKQLKASWTCPNCHTAQVLTREYVQLGYIPFRKNFLNTPRFVANKNNTK